MTMMFVHDNDISNLYVGKVISQGEVFFQEGTSGWATGNHVHLECGKGQFDGSGWHANAYGVWMINNSILPYNALYLSNTTVRLSDYSYNWRTVIDNHYLDVNIIADSAEYASGHANVTFDVTINGSKVANDVRDYYNQHAKGATYIVNDIKVSGCYKNNGNSSYSGTLNSEVKVNISIVTQHSFDSGKITTAATCTSTGMKTYTCTGCGTTKTETVAALGHNYGAWTNLNDTQHQRICKNDNNHKETASHTWGNAVITKPATCTEPGTKQYTCSICSGIKTETYSLNESNWSNWSTTQPPEGDNYILESKTQYRYRDKQTEYGYDTSRAGWTATPYKWVSDGSGTIDHAVSWPSDSDHAFDTSNTLYAKYNKPVNSYETDQWKRTIDSDAKIGYVYYHWCRNEAQSNGPKNRIVYSIRENEYSTFHAFYSTQDCEYKTFSGYLGAFVSSQPSVCMDSYYWSDYRVQINRASYTDYRMQYQYTRWTDYSNWQDTPVSSSSTREVETQTVYRYKLKSSVTGAHVWNAGTVTTAPTCTAAGVKTYTCTVCAATKTETVAALGHNYGEWAQVREATCTEEGLMERECIRCHGKETKTVSVIPHVDENEDGHCDVCGADMEVKHIFSPFEWLKTFIQFLRDWFRSIFA